MKGPAVPASPCLVLVYCFLQRTGTIWLRRVSADSQNCVVRILYSISPSFRISFGVKHGEDDDAMLAKDKEDFIREPP